MERFVASLDVLEGPKAGWTPSMECRDKEYLQFTSLGGEGYTNDRFFHFFGPTGPVQHSLVLWNDPKIWRRMLLPDLNWVSIAEDGFGNQFCMRFDGRRPVVKELSIWTGEFNLVGNSLSQFIEDFILDPTTGRELKEYYQRNVQEYGGWRPYHHLSPCIPPLLSVGTADGVDEYEWTEASANISFQAQVLANIRKVPPGTKISRIKLTRD